MGYKSEKAKREIRDHNKDYLGLTEFEIMLHEATMSLDYKEYPEELKDLVSILAYI
jgi:hypothetical protein